jgi:hypothetical protein
MPRCIECEASPSFGRTHSGRCCSRPADAGTRRRKYLDGADARSAGDVRTRRSRPSRRCTANSRRGVAIVDSRVFPGGSRRPRGRDSRRAASVHSSPGEPRTGGVRRDRCGPLEYEPLNDGESGSIRRSISDITESAADSAAGGGDTTCHAFRRPAGAGWRSRVHGNGNACDDVSSSRKPRPGPGSSTLDRSSRDRGRSPRVGPASEHADVGHHHRVPGPGADSNHGRAGHAVSGE